MSILRSIFSCLASSNYHQPTSQMTVTGTQFFTNTCLICSEPLTCLTNINYSKNGVELENT